ncbi:MAG: nuclear transport factor 2 family protein, partial [Polyangiaceae bacterium]
MIDRRSLLAFAPAGFLTLSATRGAVASDSNRGEISTYHVKHWAELYSDAWIKKDADRAIELFTPGATYEAIPGVAEQTFVGHAAIHKYWT